MAEQIPPLCTVLLLLSLRPVYKTCPPIVCWNQPPLAAKSLLLKFKEICQVIEVILAAQLKLAVVGVSTPWKLENASPRELVVKHLLAHHCYSLHKVLLHYVIRSHLILMFMDEWTTVLR